MHEEISFTVLERALKSVGFNRVHTSGPQKVYTHPSDALVVLPPYGAKDSVRPIHLVAVRRTLSEKGVVKQDAFDKLLKGQESKVSMYGARGRPVGNLTKSHLVAKMATYARIGPRQAEKALESFQEDIVNAISKGEKVTIAGFGTFSTVRRKAATGRNPQTGARIKIPAKRVPKFSPGIRLREAASKGKARKTGRRARTSPR